MNEESVVSTNGVFVTLTLYMERYDMVGDSIASATHTAHEFMGSHMVGVPGEEFHRLFIRDDYTKGEKEAPCAECIDCTDRSRDLRSRIHRAISLR